MSAPGQAAPRVAVPGPLGFGGAPLGNLFAPVAEADAAAALRAAWEAGIRYFDTAPLYGAGLSEHRIGAALRARPRDDYVLSTKVGRMLVPDPSAGGAQDGYVGALPFRVRFDYSEAAARRSVEDSLMRLGLARIDIAFIHDVGEDTHGAAWEEAFATAMRGAARALSAMRAEGLIGGWGLGVNRVAPCLRALREADPDVFLLAGRYTLLDTEAARDLLPLCAARGVRVVLGGPYNSGVLAGGSTFDYRPVAPETARLVAEIASVCAAHGVSLKAAALRFCAAPQAVAAVIAGMRTAEEVAENVRLMRTPIPQALWRDLKAKGLLPPDVPEPAERPGA